MTTKPELPATFKDFALPEPLLKALDDSGYETPTPIQTLMIPLILTGKDVLGQAQTGTGKTAAFALPLLSRVNLNKPEPQILVLTPTRELAIQVAEAFQKYGSHLPGLKVLAVYGGQEYGPQLRGLSRGVHVVVGTPGRVMDHIERQTLNLDSLTCLVLDEADEMLKMGFKEDVEWVLEHTPDERQIALFSATLPAAIRAIAKKYLKEPEEIIIRNKTSTVELTRQRYWLVRGLHKLDALSRILEVETYDAVLIFVRTKSATLDIADQLTERGFAVAPLNGDILQAQRERTVEQLKSGRMNIIVATDVAARGLDVERISMVINYDIPYDTEAYIHRIGRTGRAGRSGEAILFVSPREQRMLQTIERATRQKIEAMEVPSVDAVNAVRIAQFKKKISETLAKEDWKPLTGIMETLARENDIPPMNIAAALAAMLHGDRPFLLSKALDKPIKTFESSGFRKEFKEEMPRERKGRSEERPSRKREDRERHHDEGEGRKPRRSRDDHSQEEGKVTYRIEVGRFHGVRPGQIMGAIAGETGIDGKSIGRIALYEDFSTVDLPDTMSETHLKKLKRVRVVGRALMITRFDPNRADQEMSRPTRQKKHDGPISERFSSHKSRGKPFPRE